jgi:hypothetical protein
MLCDIWWGLKPLHRTSARTEGLFATRVVRFLEIHSRLTRNPPGPRLRKGTAGVSVSPSGPSSYAPLRLPQFGDKGAIRRNLARGLPESIVDQTIGELVEASDGKILIRLCQTIATTRGKHTCRSAGPRIHRFARCWLGLERLEAIRGRLICYPARSDGKSGLWLLRFGNTHP